jgi:hypothetical protein
LCVIASVFICQRFKLSELISYQYGQQEASSWPEWCKTKEDQQMYINNYYEKEGTWLTAEHIKKNLKCSVPMMFFFFVFDANFAMYLDS